MLCSVVWEEFTDIPPKRWQTSKRLYGMKSQKAVLSGMNGAGKKGLQHCTHLMNADYIPMHYDVQEC
jgi:hypothetical protein